MKYKILFEVQRENFSKFIKSRKRKELIKRLAKMRKSYIFDHLCIFLLYNSFSWFWQPENWQTLVVQEKFTFKLLSFLAYFCLSFLLQRDFHSLWDIQIEPQTKIIKENFTPRWNGKVDMSIKITPKGKNLYQENFLKEVLIDIQELFFLFCNEGNFDFDLDFWIKNIYDFRIWIKYFFYW